MIYFLSQVFVVLSYVFLGATYATKNRNLLLCFSIIAIVFNGVSYTLLGAWAGLAVTIVALLRNIVFLIQEKFEGDKDYTKMDWIVLCVLMIISATFAYFTYDGWLSLFTTLSSVIYTISVWQHNVTAYKVLGVISSAFSIVYFVFIWSIFGFILESVLFVFMVAGLVKHLMEKRKEKQKETADGIG